MRYIIYGPMNVLSIQFRQPQVAVRLRGPCTSAPLSDRVVEGHRKLYNYQLSTINCQLLYPTDYTILFRVGWALPTTGLIDGIHCYR